jgi:hypothetical protein
MAQKTLNTVIILRNGSKEAWEATDSYCLQAGEVGVGYMGVEKTIDGEKTTVQIPIIKVGDGTTAWKNLPQAEGVFENDVVLTSPLGQYTPSAAGFIKVEGSKGMTTSEFLLSALSKVKEPNIKAPTFSLTATQPGTVEVGTPISSLAWTGTYSCKDNYEFGSKKDTTTYTKAQGSGQTVTGYEVTCSLPGTVDQKEDGSVSLKTDFVVAEAKEYKDFATVTSKCSWTASDRTPLNNVGVETSGMLAAGSSTQTVKYTVTGYREGFFYGTSATAIEDPTSLTGWNIKSLSKTGGSYANIADADSKTAGKQVVVDVPVGAASIILACPKANTGVTDVLNTTVNAGMNDAFGLSKPTVISVGGADATKDSVGNYAEDYNVWVYTPAEAYGSTASLTVTLG